MKHKLLMRVLAFSLALTTFASSAVAVYADDEEQDTTTASETADDDLDLDEDEDESDDDVPSYIDYREMYADETRPEVADDEGYIYSSEYQPEYTGDSVAELSVEEVDGKTALKWANQDGSVSFPVTVAESGLYAITISYEALAGSTDSVELELQIDGESPYDTATRITLSKRWVNEEDIKQDDNGNDIRPGQVEEVCWQETYLKDIDGLYNDALWFYFEAGEHTVTLESVKAQFAIESIKLTQEAETEAYVAPSDSELEANSDADVITVQGEDAIYKSDRTLSPTSDRNSSITQPSDPTKTKYNTIGSENWSQSTQSITWEVEVETSGYYKLGIRGRQDQMRGLYSNRKLYIDGVVPNTESEQIKFYYSSDWTVTTPQDEDGNDIYYYLEAGTHTITLEAIPGEIGDIMAELDDVVYEITSYYRKIRQITGPDPDEYNDYQIDKVLPDIISDFERLSDELIAKKDEIEALSGVAGSEAVTLEKMAIVLDNCVDRPINIPSNLSQIKDNITSVSSWMREYREQPLEIDMFQLAPAGKDFDSVDEGFLDSLSFGFQAFIGSFFEDYNSLSSETEDSLVCWVSLGRDQAQVVNQLVESDFNPTSDTKITVNLVQGGIVEATLAGKGPDIALFIGGDFPIQLAARDVLTDLTTFDDYDEVMTRFQENASVLYEYNGGTYGLPVSQTIPMMFYREDILAEYGIDAEEDIKTWDDLIDILPVLQSNYMEVGLVLPVTQNTSANGTAVVSTTVEAGNTFAMLMLQQGLNYYTEDQTSTTFDSQEAIDAFTTWTKFYTTYSFDQQYDGFTRFRTGDMPLLIQPYTFYNQVTVSAPEIKGCWGMTTVPGTLQEDGTIDHTANSTGTGAIIFKKCENQEAAWEFIKWFTSTETQIDYAFDIEAVMGTMGRFDTANLEALEQLSWSTSDMTKLLAQFETQDEIPVIPASYAVTRNIMNAFRETVNNSENPRDTLMWYNKDINSEIERKLEDLEISVGSD
ncbi:MAG: extracellular solute-binding protein [Ruminococcus sp.]|nr:extracellular solute-binding protein [Ruminococcus sp.]